MRHLDAACSRVARRHWPFQSGHRSSVAGAGAGCAGCLLQSSDSGAMHVVMPHTCVALYSSRCRERQYAGQNSARCLIRPARGSCLHSGGSFKRTVQVSPTCFCASFGLAVQPAQLGTHSNAVLQSHTCRGRRNVSPRDFANSRDELICWRLASPRYIQPPCRFGAHTFSQPLLVLICLLIDAHDLPGLSLKDSGVQTLGGCGELQKLVIPVPLHSMCCLL